MSQATSCPSIVHDVQSYSIVQGKTFSININELFRPRDGTLKFYLKSTAPPWLHMDKYQGVLYGVAPQVPYTKRFKIHLVVGNEMGHVTKSFIIVVVDTDVVETMPQTLEYILSMRKGDYGLSHLHPYTPSLIEYLYYFYQQPEYLAQFEKSVRHAAQKYNIELSDKKISFHDFDSVLKKINPRFEEILRESLKQDHILNVTTLNNQQLRNMFRQGSQEEGVISIPVWNHCAYPDLYNWPNMHAISNVLDAAAEEVNRLEHHRSIHQKSPTLKPRIFG